MSAAISVDVTTRDDGWFARVGVDTGDHRTGHLVTVRGDYVEKIAGATADIEDVVRASFEFLLEREPASAILRKFDLPVIARYFPEYESAMKERFGRP
jgi:hypothetical protein